MFRETCKIYIYTCCYKLTTAVSLTKPSPDQVLVDDTAVVFGFGCSCVCLWE